MPLYVYCSASESLRPSRSSEALNRLCAQGLLLLAAMLFACLPFGASAQQNSAVQRLVSGACESNDAAGQVMSRVQQRGSVPLSLCEGRALGGGRLQVGSGDPVALASADFDEDGVPDLISGFAASNGGSITIHRGNIAALWPYGAASLNSPPQAFFPDARTFTLPERPDFVVTGDFDADGHWDIITGQRGSSNLYFLKGNGHGTFLAPKPIDVSGSVTAMIAGEMNRADGLADIIVAVTTAAGPRALVYESPRGAVKAEPEIFTLPHAATALALGRFDGGGLNGLAVGAGSQLMIVHGRDRRLSLSTAQRASVSPAKTTQQEMPFAITAIVAGDFTGTGPSIAALGSDNRVHILEGPLTQPLLGGRAAANSASVSAIQVANQESGSASAGTITPGTAAKLAMLPNVGNTDGATWTERSAVDLPSGFEQTAPQLIAARVAGSQQEDVLAVDSGNRQVHVLSTEAVAQPSQRTALSSVSSSLPQRAAMKLTASLQSQSTPSAVLPMRLGRHGLNGLVMLQSGSASPVLMPHDVPPANIFVVTNTLDITGPKSTATVPPGSLREAMNKVEALSGANSGGSYEIDFNIPTTDPGYNAATGVFTIKPFSESVPGALDDFALPPINATVTIDGYTQPGASPNTLANGDNAKILIQIDGSKAATPGGSGFVPFNDVGSVFRGFDFTGWTNPDVSNTGSGSVAAGGWGIEANGVGDFIEGNFFGTDPTGKVAAPNRIGVFGDNGPLFGSAPGNIIGGTTPQARNILSGNTTAGILLNANAYESQVQGNFIGLDATGAKSVPNTFDGVGLNGTTVTIGGSLPGAANFIAGNGTNVDLNDLLNGGAARNSTVQGNYIGTNATGTAGIASQGNGVSILHNVMNMMIGGTTPAARNVISGNLAGVSVFDNSYNNVVQGNFIGTDPTGSKAVPNTKQGVIVGSTGSTEAYAYNTFIGGSVAGAGNLISGNTSDGINISGTNQPNAQLPFSGNTIEGNLIGTNAAGTAALPNGGSGVYLTGSATNNTIGGSEPGSGNFIAYNVGNGVLIDPGTTGGGNQTIANIIDSNTGAGVRVSSGTGNRISQNSIFGNKALGIDVDASGPNTNAHCNTPNTGANNLQNYPVLTAGAGSIFISATATDPNGNTSEFSKAVAATETGNVVSLLGSFDSTANTKFNIEFFSSPSADSSGYGQGQTYLGSTTITTDANCMAGITDPIDLSQADVSVTLAQPSQLVIGADMGFYAYKGTVINNGPAIAHNVVFTDTLPSQLAVSSAYCNVASCVSPITTSLGACTVNGQKITCNLGTMAPGATAVVTIPVQTVASGTVINTATVSATEPDPNLTNNTSSPSGNAVYPFPLIDHLSPSTALVNSADLPLTIYGEQILSNSTVTFNGTSLPVKGFIDNQVCGGPFQTDMCSALQVVVPASLLTTAGTPAVVVSNPDPGQGGGANSPSSSNFTVAASCTYSPFSSLDGEEFEADGVGLIAETVSVGTNVASCPWTATSSVPWAVILDHPSNVGPGTVDINIAANIGTATRTGTVTVAGTTYTFTQDGGSSCPDTLDSSTANSPAAGGTGSVNVTTGSSCAYFVEPYADWITIPKTSGLLVGSGTASYVVAANHGAPRTGSVAVGASTLMITQQSPTCYFTLDTNSALIPVTGGTGTIAVTASAPSCAWTATSSNTSQLSVTSGASGTGNGTVEYSLPVNAGGLVSPTLTIGNASGYSVFTANQSSAFTCTFTIAPTPRSVSSLGTTDFFTITASYNFCKWTATSNDPTALTVNQGISGTGTGAVYYSLAKNTGDARTVTITAGCQTFTINQSAPLASNPVPAITTLLPASVTAGSGATTLTVTGSNFVNGAVVNFNGTARTTTFVSATQVTAAILATDIATAGTFPVTVANPTPGGGTSNSVNFTVNPAVTNNPVPTITTLLPSSVTAGAGATTLTINGTNFVSGSIVNFNGAAKATTFVSATQVKAALLAADVATAGTYAVTVTNPTPGGGTSNSVNFTVNPTVTDNPVPTITTLQPSSVTAGAGATTLTINGMNFASSSVVSFNGASKSTTFVSATQVKAALLAADVATAGTYAVTVANPTPGGGTSNSVSFTVIPAVMNNPAPTLTTLQPLTVAAGAGATTLTITGTNFISSSVVNFNGAAKTTTFVSSTQLMAALLATDVATAGTFPVTVINPAPGGGTSTAVNFTVTAVAVPAPQVSFSPTTLTFPSTSPTAASTAQTVTLTNSGNATLNITGISVTGANASAFAQTNTCGATLSPEGSCTLSVIFTPPATGSYSASLSVADDANGSPQTVGLSGTGSALPSFAVSSTTAAQTISAGGTAQYSITVAAQNGTFSGTVTLSASGLPPGATATFSPAGISPGSASATSQLTIQTAAPTTASAGFSKGWTITAALLPMFALFLAVRKRRTAWPKLALLVFTSLAMATVLTGCGGGFGLGSTATAKTYTVTVTGTSGETQQSTTVQIIVK